MSTEPARRYVLTISEEVTVTSGGMVYQRLRSQYPDERDRPADAKDRAGPLREAPMSGRRCKALAREFREKNGRDVERRGQWSRGYVTVPSPWRQLKKAWLRRKR